MALTCGTPTPATTRVVQIDPGPTPTFTPSAAQASPEPQETGPREPYDVVADRIFIRGEELFRATIAGMGLTGIVLDADPIAAGPARIWPLDRLLRPERSESLEPEPVFVTVCDPAAGDDDPGDDPVAGGPRRALPWNLPDGRPTAIDAISDGTFVVLDEEQVVRISLHRALNIPHDRDF